MATKDLKLAVRAQADQRSVWQKITEAQKKLTRNVGAQVAAPASPSSFMLSLEDGNVRRSAEAYMGALSGILDGQQDVIGYAFAIDGKINSAEVYASSDLFRRLWPKLLRASAVEAVAEAQAGAAFVSPSVEAVGAALRDAQAGKSSERELNSRTRVISAESGGGLFFETRDGGAWIHRSYLSK